MYNINRVNLSQHSQLLALHFELKKTANVAVAAVRDIGGLNLIRSKTAIQLYTKLLPNNL